MLPGCSADITCMVRRIERRCATHLWVQSKLDRIRAELMECEYGII